MGDTSGVPVDIPPAIEESVLRLRDGRRLGYAVFGAPGGDTVLWFHGTPGGRRQVPPGVRIAAAEAGVRVVGIDRPGTGASTSHLHASILEYSGDIEQLADALGADRFGIVGLSGGGPYVLGCAYAMPTRVVAGVVLGGVAPTLGDEGVQGGVAQLARRFGPVLNVLREPLGVMLTGLTRLARPIENQAFDLYMRNSPPGDQRVFSNPEMREMFIADLRSAARTGLKAPVYDAILFGKPWGFSPSDVKVPIAFWHGDSDNIVPLHHARHLQALVRGSTLSVRAGESHLGALEAGEEILATILEHWSDREHRPAEA
jgi:pimeloyl-ACP methyl ester carboxylesterase